MAPKTVYRNSPPNNSPNSNRTRLVPNPTMRAMLKPSK